ncbi:MAG: deoxyribose-phosphate aldolase [Bacteroidales bacterium]|nr:deoxyribose-phosphate aldolase [Bacteroidales bacterium]
MIAIFEKYGYAPTDIEAKVAAVKAQAGNWCNKNVWKDSLGLIDLTSLTVSDTPTQIAAMTEKVNRFNDVYPDYPKPASICVYPNFAKTVKEAREDKDVHITIVGGCFPASQSFLEVKVAECLKAVEVGADEVDIVLALNAFLDGRHDDAAKEMSEIKKAITSVNGNVHLKVILETGALRSHEEIAVASFLAMEAGADFIKTSTGKIGVSATPEAAYIMCECIAAFISKGGRKVGFKPAGGIRSAEDASLYYGIVDTVLGKEWLTPQWFRFGASSMANNLLSALEGTTVKYY